MAKFNSRQGERKRETVVKIKGGQGEGKKEEKEERRKKEDSRWRDRSTGKPGK